MRRVPGHCVAPAEEQVSGCMLGSTGRVARCVPVHVSGRCVALGTSRVAFLQRQHLATENPAHTPLKFPSDFENSISAQFLHDNFSSFSGSCSG